jgi:hypothetical protein
VSAKLGPFGEGRFPGRSWEELLKISEGRGTPYTLGEVRVPEDWRNLPKNANLRVILLRSATDYVLRWGHPKRMKEVFGFQTHGYLVGRSDFRYLSLKSGYVEVRSNGEIVLRR